MEKRAQQLREMGHIVTSRWLVETVRGDVQLGDVSEQYKRLTATDDIEDVISADIVVMNTPSREDFENYNISLSTWARGGRHFEAGFQYALMYLDTYGALPKWIKGKFSPNRELILIGHRENVFHSLDGKESVYAHGFLLPPIKCYETWNDYIETLKSEKIVGSLAT